MQSVYQRALATWGEDMQINMAFEEMAECMVALSNYRRGRGTKEELASEVADVFIMMNQLKLIAGEDLVGNQIVYKVERLRLRLDGKVPVQHG